MQHLNPNPSAKAASAHGAIESHDEGAPESQQQEVPATQPEPQSQPEYGYTQPSTEIDDDKPLLIVRPNIRGNWPEIILAVSMILVVYFLKDLLVQGYADMVTTATTEQIMAFSAFMNKTGFWVTILTCLTLYARILFVQHNEKLFLGKTYVEMHRGIIARKRTRISLEHIRTVDTNQGVIDRLLNIGSIEVATAGTADSELVVNRILDPIEVRNAIKQQQQRALAAS